MNHCRSILVYFISSLLLFSGCVLRKVPPKVDTLPIEEKEKKTDLADLVKEEYIEPDKAALIENPRTIIYTPHPDGRSSDLVAVLQENPKFKITLAFPANYFKEEWRTEDLEAMKVLVSSKQIEVALVLDYEPILPLLGNLMLAGENAEIWGFDFSWPSDITDHIALGSSDYQKQWGELPSGFVPPYFKLSPLVVDSLKRFRLNWILGKPSEQSGVLFFGNTALLVPEIIPQFENMYQGTQAWASTLSAWAIEKPFVYIDARGWDNPRWERRFLQALSKDIHKNSIPLVSTKKFSEVIDESLALPSDYDVFAADYSEWVQSDQQRRAWKALSEGRQTVERYKNSGRANLRRLDAAINEILIAEKGPFLQALGQSLVPLTLNEKNFIATLANVYRLCGKPIPPNLERTFSKSTYRKMKMNNRATGPFFVKGERELTWNDPSKDDFGGGDVVYPIGPFPIGSFDLRSFRVKWSISSITLIVSFTHLPTKNKNNVLPLVDVYIDVNRVAGAGQSTPLRDRGPALIAREAAWEYAVTMGPHVATLYQSIPGQGARNLKNLKPRIHSDARSFSVTIPRNDLRGDPLHWRMTLAVMGSEVTSSEQSPIPAGILSTANQKNFGGAKVGRSPPKFIDLLAETIKEQTDQLKKYENGLKGTLPFVELQEMH